MRSIWMICCALAIPAAACSSPSGDFNEPPELDQRLKLKDQEYLDALHEDFLEVSGKDFVEFEMGSSRLSPSAEFRIERQVLWLLAYSTVAIKLEASGDGLEKVKDRRLAMARAHAVRDHLIRSGIPPHQIVAIEVAGSGSGPRQVVTRIDPFQLAAGE